MSLSRIAGAPISWGVCEVPNWGYQLSAERVLGEMETLGLTATELGPDGFLPHDPDGVLESLGDRSLCAIGGFVGLVLHLPDSDPWAELEEYLDRLRAVGATVLVLAAATGSTSYDTRPALSDTGWSTLLANLSRVAEYAAAKGLTATLHPHVGTMIESRQDVLRLLAESAISLCLDTGHLLIGGTDPLEIVDIGANRIEHVHLKDVDVGLAGRVRAGDMSYSEAVTSGMYRPLGKGDVKIGEIVERLSDAGYSGWYVLEQDTILHSEPAEGAGPMLEVAASMAFLQGIE